MHSASADITELADNFGREDRYSAVKAIPGTLSHHSFIPFGKHKFKLKDFM